MEQKGFGVLAFLALFYIGQITAAPKSFVVRSADPPKENEPTKEGDAPLSNLNYPEIYQMNIQSNIRNRFSRTVITSKVKNYATKSQEATFAVVLPESAFISGFIMEVDGKNYTAYVREKEAAKKVYDEAVASGLGAAHVAVSARDSNRFTVSVNVEPEKKAAFYLTYEQLLKRQDGRYEQIINIHPGHPVKDLNVEVIITESRKLVNVKAPPLRTGNEIGSDKEDLDPRADIQIFNGTAAVIKFSPNVERQKQLASLLGTNSNDGLAGQFVVQYDVERDPQGGEVLVQDGYFVHFFAPTELKPLPKHVVFVLDTSGSMYGQKIKQLREAMHKIMEQLNSQDLFNLVEFNTNVKVWDMDKSEDSVWFPKDNTEYSWSAQKDVPSFDDYKFPSAYPANTDNIKKAKNTVSQMNPDGGTDIHTALKVGLHLVEVSRVIHKNHQPIIVFLTDGDPTVRITSIEEITNKISEYNSESRKSPIFALSFGRGADKKFLETLSLRNSGFSRHIYEAADASLQLQDFYRQISSPLLSDVKFKYEPSVTSLTTTDFPIHFGGSELVVAGWCGTGNLPTPTVDGLGPDGRIMLRPRVEQSISSTERLWAYLTIQQLLEKKEASEKDKEELKKKALDLALKYSFVTPVSSLVVVKPNDTKAVNTEEASVPRPDRPGIPLLAASPGIALQSNSFSSYGMPGIAGPSGVHSTIADRGDVGRPQFEAMPRPIPPTFVPLIVHTTEAPTTSKPDLFTTLPWLKNILNDNGYLTLPAGKYKLGLNETITDDVACPKTPLNAAGHCTLLHSCPEVYDKLKSSDDFVKHMCVLKDEFAGICCPSKN